ncbi:unnamed protein product, partial [Mesorhabditis belari]|uniref:Uncharacterized protein n=1 Tax=Mesorhabditis belari TaxID=2138241 RepID=A0AAF3FIM7_9BILA
MRLSGALRRCASVLFLALFLVLLFHFFYTLFHQPPPFAQPSYTRIEYVQDSPKYVPYPKRKNMDRCEHIYGKVTIFIGANKDSFKEHYKVSHSTLQCYLKGTDYELRVVDIYNDPRVTAKCSHHHDIMFHRHCALAQYLNESDWWLVMDADTGVVNPEHCIEEFIDPRVNFVFYERFFNLEVMAGNWIVKNTPFAKKFIEDWANWEFRRPNLPFGTNDNCILHMNLLEHLFNETSPRSVAMCDEIWRNRSKDYWSYFGMVFCAKTMFGANRFWPGKFKILPKGQGFARDAFLTDQKFSDRDFLYHGWKQMKIGEDGWQSPYEKIPEIEKCREGSMDGWYFRKDAKVDEKKILESLMGMETGYMKEVPEVARVIPWLTASELKDCFPNCMDSRKL